MTSNPASAGFAWPRWWVPSATDVQLEQDAFLWDPDGRFSTGVNPDARQIEGVSERLAVLLGEPGAGKTHSVSNYARDRDGVMLISLPDEVSAHDLRSRVDELLTSDLDDIELIFDGLDEAMIRAGNSDVWVPAALRGRPRSELDRLRVRITCRPAAWPQSLLPRLTSLWPDEQSAAVELTLTPLRRTDVLAAAAAAGIDGQAFLAALADRDALAFAARPVTLWPLLMDYAEGSLLTTKTAIYHSMCRRLARELNRGVHDATNVRSSPGANAFEIAGRLAALSEFTGRPVIWHGVDDRDRRPLELDAEAAAQDSTVDRHAISESINTALFGAAGSDRFRFAHRTYGEFLAAHHAVERGVSTRDLLGLVLDQTGQAVQPQLGEVAAWIAALQPEIFDFLVDQDPVVLLDSDVATQVDEDRERLAASILAGQEAEPAPPVNLAKLRHLACPPLEPLITEVLTGSGHRRRARQAALEIASALPQMQSTLVALVCDTNADNLLRAAAARRISPDVSGPDRVRLANLLEQPTLDVELRGALLSHLWPTTLTLSEVLAAASQPTTATQGRRVLTSYDHFLSRDLARLVDGPDLRAVLEWARTVKDVSDAHGDAADALLSRSLRELRPEIAIGAAELLVDRARHYGRGRADVEAALGFVATDNEKRRQLFSALVATGDDRTLVLAIRYAGSQDDFAWALANGTDASIDAAVRCRWLALANRLFAPFIRPDQLDDLWRFADAPDVQRVFWEVINGVPTAGPIADQWRARHTDERRWAEETTRWEQSIQVDRQAVAAALADDSPDAWIALMVALDPVSAAGAESDLAQIDGWQKLTESEHAKAIAIARRWLAARAPEVDSDGEWPMESVYGLRAMWLHDHDSALLDGLRDEQWTAWARVLVGFAAVGANETQLARRDLLLRRSYDHAPDSVHAALLHELGREARNAEGELAARPTEPGQTPDPLRPVNGLYTHRTLASIWTDDLSNVLLDWQRGRVDDIGIVDTVPFLHSHGCKDAEDLAVTALNSTGTTTASTRRRVAGAVALLRCSGGSRHWPAIWDLWTHDVAFAQAVLTHLHRSQSGWELPVELAVLKPSDLAELYLWLHPRLPSTQATMMNPVADLADAIINRLVNAAARDSLEVLQRIAQALPGDANLPYRVAEAERLYRESNWIPPRVDDVAKLLADPRRRLATTDGSLAAVIVESLRRAQSRISGETPAVADLWDHPHDAARREPKIERDLSDWLKRHLSTDLQSVMVNREVEITPGFTGTRKMREVDLYVAALSSADPEGATRLRVIVENKGCWNADVLTDMKAQLVDTYLAQTQAGAGIYVVFAFDCVNSGSLRTCPSCKVRTMEQLREELERQAAQLSNADRSISVVVLDARLAAP